MKDFDNWNARKKQINSSDKQRFFNTREVWWAYLGINVGAEQDGKNQDFVRPILVLRKFNNEVFLGLPLSTQIKSDNKFYTKFMREDQEISAVISQIKFFDSRRLKRKMYRLDREQFGKIQSEVIKMIRQEN